MNYSQQDIEDRVIPPKPSASPRWLLEDYEGAEADIANDIFSAIYWDEYTKAEATAKQNGSELDVNDILARTQVIAESMGRASIQAHRMKGNMGRAFDLLVYRMKSNGFVRAIRGEYDNIQAWLLDKIPELNDDSGELSDILFLQNTVVPAIESLGNGTAARLMGMQEQWSKTRAGVPYLRDHAKLITGAEHAYEESVQKIEKQIKKLNDRASFEKDPEKKQELLNQVVENRKLIEREAKIKDAAVKAGTLEFKGAFVKFMDVVQDPSIPVNGPNGVRHVLKRDGNVTIYTGEKCYPDDRQVTFVLTLPIAYEQAMESMLRHLAKFQMTDGSGIVARLGQLILRKGG